MKGPLPSPEAIAECCTRLKARGRELRSVPVREICAALGQVSDLWLAADFPERRQALREISENTGFPRRTLERALDNLFGELGRDRLIEVVEAEIGDPSLLDHAGDGKGTFVRGPELTLHVLPGNVPGAGIFGIVAALLLKSPSLVKCSSREPLLPYLFTRSLLKVPSPAAAAISSAVAVTTWPGGERDLEKAALAHAESVLVHGDEQTISAFAVSAGDKLIAYGPRLSAGLILGDAERELDLAARKAAESVVLFDQRGCLSPQFFLLEQPCDATRFAGLLAAELDRLASALPRSRLALDEACRLRSFVEHWRWKMALSNSAGMFLEEDSLQWVVVVGSDTELMSAPGNRAVTVIPVESADHAVKLLAPLAGRIEAVGVLGETGRMRSCAPALSLAGAARVCPLERLQRPPFGWRQGGRPRLASLARWLAIEGAAEGHGGGVD